MGWYLLLLLPPPPVIIATDADDLLLAETLEKWSLSLSAMEEDMGMAAEVAVPAKGKWWWW